MEYPLLFVYFSQVAVNCFLPLIVLNFAYPNWTRTKPVFDAVAQLAQMKYNYTYRPDEMVLLVQHVIRLVRRNLIGSFGNLWEWHDLKIDLFERQAQ